MQLHCKIWLLNYEAEEVLGDILFKKKNPTLWCQLLKKIVCAIIIITKNQQFIDYHDYIFLKAFLCPYWHFKSINTCLYNFSLSLICKVLTSHQHICHKFVQVFVELRFCFAILYKKKRFKKSYPFIIWGTYRIYECAIR